MALDLRAVLDAVRVHGSVEAAADALGVPAETLRVQWQREKRRVQVRQAHARYRQTDKFKAARARYRASAKGRATTARSQARRFWVRGGYKGRAATTGQAMVIRQHVQQRLHELKQRLAHREKTEGVHARQVPTEAAV